MHSSRRSSSRRRVDHSIGHPHDGTDRHLLRRLRPPGRGRRGQGAPASRHCSRRWSSSCPAGFRAPQVAAHDSSRGQVWRPRRSDCSAQSRCSFPGRSPPRWWPPRTRSSSASLLYARARGGALATCGCFGRPDTPPTSLHVAVNLVLLAAAILVAFARPMRPRSSSCSTTNPGSGLPLLFVSGVGVWVTYLALSPLAALEAARRLVQRPSAQDRCRLVSLSSALVERTSSFLEGRLSRRSLINRSAFVGQRRRHRCRGGSRPQAWDRLRTDLRVRRTPAVAVAAPAARDSPSSAARSVATTTAPRTP